MRLRVRYAFWVLVVGAGLTVIPAVASSAGSNEATVSGLSSDMWSPMEVAITPGGTVTFQNTTAVPHGVVWTNVPETPKCTGVPIDEGKANWTGTCTFVEEGVYEYYCYVHGTYMSGVIVVNAAATTTTTTTTQSTSMTSTATKTSSSSTTTKTSSVTTQTSTTPSSTSTQTTSTQTSSSLAPMSSQTTSASATEAGMGAEGKAGNRGGAARDSLSGGSLKLARSQHSTSVRGSVNVARAGSRLEVELFAHRASIAAGSHASEVLVGRFTKSKLPAGRFTFKVSLNRKAKRALARQGRLRLRMKAILDPPHGKGVTRTLAVTLHR